MCATEQIARTRNAQKTTATTGHHNKMKCPRKVVAAPLVVVLGLLGLLRHCAAQRNVLETADIPTEVLKCAQYQKAVYEKVVKYSAFIHNVPERSITVNTCRRSTPLIVGGEAAQPQEFPHIARLGTYARDRGRRPGPKWFCGGILISEKFVLTAAHCLYSPTGAVEVVRLGELDFGSNLDDAQPQDFAVLQTIPHPSYTLNLAYNDIALVELDGAVTFSRYIVPACLPVRSTDNAADFVAIGWGMTEPFKDRVPTLLQKVRLHRIGHEECDALTREDENDKFPTSINRRSQLCAGSNQRRDTCFGDSGGPLLTPHDAYRCMYYVAGITSTSLGGCALPEVPGIYTAVYNYNGWIRNWVWP